MLPRTLCDAWGYSFEKTRISFCGFTKNREVFFCRMTVRDAKNVCDEREIGAKKPKNKRKREVFM